MAHTPQERYSSMLDEKLRATLVTRDNYIFNTRYEGTPKAGKVKIPVRDTEVVVSGYNKSTGLNLKEGTTTYIDLVLDHDKAINELIDGFDAASVPDGILAERIDSGGYSLAATIDADSIKLLEEDGTDMGDTTAITSENVYEKIVDMYVKQSETNVPPEGRWLIVSPKIHGALLRCDEFVRYGDMSQEMKMTGAIGQVAGFAVYESARLDTATDMIAGHPNWCHRVMEWEVPVAIKDLTNTYIGASAVQGRKIYGMLISKPQVVLVKSHE